METVVLPKSILLKDQESGQSAYLPPHMLTPSAEFDIKDTDNSFIVHLNGNEASTLLESEWIDAETMSESESLSSRDCSSLDSAAITTNCSQINIQQDHQDALQFNQLDEDTFSQSFNLDHRINDNNRPDQQEELLMSIRPLLPKNFTPGIDGLGSRSLVQRRAASYFNEPWKFTDDEIQSLVKVTKHDFLKLVISCLGAKIRSHGNLNIFACCFLFLYKLTNQVSYDMLATLFCLPNVSSAFDAFHQQVLHQFRFNCNIPNIIFNDKVNQPEIDKLLQSAHRRTPIFFKVLLKDLEDPSGNGRTPVVLNIDGTYIDIQGSEDLEFQKHMYYQPRSNHVAKMISFTDLSPKIVGLLPIASSQTPSSGDGLLTAKHIELEHGTACGQYIRSLLRKESYS